MLLRGTAAAQLAQPLTRCFMKTFDRECSHAFPDLVTMMKIMKLSKVPPIEVRIELRLSRAPCYVKMQTFCVSLHTFTCTEAVQTTNRHIASMWPDWARGTAFKSVCNSQGEKSQRISELI